MGANSVEMWKGKRRWWLGEEVSLVLFWVAFWLRVDLESLETTDYNSQVLCGSCSWKSFVSVDSSECPLRTTSSSFLG